MTGSRAILVYSRDDEVIRRMEAALPDEHHLLEATSAMHVEEQITLHDPALMVADVRCEDLYYRLDEWLDEHPETPLIVMGPPRSDRIMALAHLDLFAVADPDFDYRAWQNLFRLALKHHRALNEVRKFKERASTPASWPAAASTAPVPIHRPPAREGPSIITRVTSAFRHFDNLDLLLDRAVEELAAAAHTTRAGLFTRDDASGQFRLRAGLRTLKETAAAAYDARDPLVKWLERHAHMITRALVGQMNEPDDRRLLLRCLELTGAEVLVPLHARGQLLGWFFVGHQATGQPYTLGDLEEFSMAADYLSMLLENALLYREVTVQKTLAETLLHALPTGIIAVDGAGIIRWFSTSAEQMFSRSASEVIGKPVEIAGSRLADAVRRSSGPDSTPIISSWEEPGSRRFLRVEVRRLEKNVERLGAIAMIQDLTSIRHLQEKQAQLERTAFWNDLAAGLSHEIRNPLVTIRTFAQLLPERYQEAEFREEFSTLVGREVARLDSIIEQINGFANPPALAHDRVDIRKVIKDALFQVFPPTKTPKIRVKSEMEGNLPLVEGDEKALTDCFVQVFQNAAEALEDKPDAAIALRAIPATSSEHQPMVQITIHDNGRGIPPDVKDKVFSPFYTTKARGMGLGLPIVKRTVIDHNGRVEVESNDSGTQVVIELPTATGQPTGGGPP